MHNPESKQLTLRSFSNYGKKLLETHEGLKQIAKRMEIGNRSRSYYQNRQPRPPCYHPGAARKPIPVKKSSSFLSITRNHSLNFQHSLNKVQSQFKYRPNFQQITAESPSWTFAKADKKIKNIFKKDKRQQSEHISLQKEINQLQTQPNQSNIEAEISIQQKSKEQKKQRSSLQMKTPQTKLFTNSLELTQKQSRNRRTKSQFSCRGYVNMMTQTSRPKIERYNTYYEYDFDSPQSTQAFIKIHKFSSYISRKETKPKPMPQYDNLNLDCIKPKSSLGHIKFAKFRGRVVPSKISQVSSISFLNTDCALSIKSPKSKCLEFEKMSGRKQPLFPKTRPNIKKKGDSTLMKILQKASQYERRAIF